MLRRQFTVGAKVQVYHGIVSGWGKGIVLTAQDMPPGALHLEGPHVPKKSTPAQQLAITMEPQSPEASPEVDVAGSMQTGSGSMAVAPAQDNPEAQDMPKESTTLTLPQ